MDVEMLARVQFAVTIMFHYIYPPLSIGLSVIIVAFEAMYLKSGNERFKNDAKFWTRIFALTFAIGVATGIVMEFEFGTNWATYSRYVGDVFGSALAAEGIFAFFLESGFLALLLFGWDRIGPKLHFFSSVMVMLGSHFSAVWIVVANAWMQTPDGFHIVGEGLNARAEITDFWTMVLNPSSIDRLIHVLLGCWLAGIFLVISVSAYYLLKRRHVEFAKDSLKVALSFALVTLILQGFSGDRSGQIVAEHQPAKLAAFEGLFHTERGVPLMIFGYVDLEQQATHGVGIPKLLSFLSFRDFNAEVRGLDQFPRSDWPNSPLLFQTFRIMIAMWVLMFVLTFWSIYLWRKGTLFNSPWTLRALAVSVLFPQIANQMGWFSAEVGRYPWIVYNLLRISDGLSKAVTANQVLWSLIMFTIVYLFLFIVFIYLLNEKIQHGPLHAEPEPAYHQIKKVVNGRDH